MDEHDFRSAGVSPAVEAASRRLTCTTIFGLTHAQTAGGTPRRTAGRMPALHGPLKRPEEGRWRELHPRLRGGLRRQLPA